MPRVVSNFCGRVARPCTIGCGFAGTLDSCGLSDVLTNVAAAVVHEVHTRGVTLDVPPTDLIVRTKGTEFERMAPTSSKCSQTVPPGAVVRVRVGFTDGQVFIEVIDSGPGVSPPIGRAFSSLSGAVPTNRPAAHLGRDSVSPSHAKMRGVTAAISALTKRPRGARCFASFSLYGCSRRRHPPRAQRRSKPMASSTEKMTLWEHLDELRARLVKALVAYLVGATAAWTYRDSILTWLWRPFAQSWRGQNIPGDPALNFAAPSDAFRAYFKLSLVAGFLFAAPVIFYQGWSSSYPASIKRKRLW